eukprot:gene15195-17974_t
MSIPIEELSRLQQDQIRVRNMCMLAHVDHGKTTLCDNLIASNGLIHPKMVGKLRFLDSREDEQARLITMKSSSISLLFNKPTSACQDGAEEQTHVAEGKQLINLIDSPGHVDFCSEVSTAARLCDGGIVLVDSSEGVCIQTHAVLRQAFEERLKLCLVVNKIDRLITELGMSPLEAYERLKQIVAEVNSIMTMFSSEKYMSEAEAVLANTGAAEEGADGEDQQDVYADFEDQEDLYQFHPEKGNVAFVSAMDGWGFRTDTFAEMYAGKIGCNPRVLQRSLWGDYFYHPKAKKIVNRRAAKELKLRKPCFVQFALEALWRMYAAAGYEVNIEGGSAASTKSLEDMAKSLKIEVNTRDMKHADPQAVMVQWLPLSRAVLGMVVDHLPSPRAAATLKLQRLLPALSFRADPPPELAVVEAGLLNADSSVDAAAVVYVSKMLSVPPKSLPRETEGQKMYVLSDVYDPSVPEAGGWREVALGDIFLMMGQGLELLDAAPAGSVVAIAGLETSVLKSATLSSVLECRPFATMTFQSAPILKVTVLPRNTLADQKVIKAGLRLLNQADPSVEVRCRHLSPGALPSSVTRVLQESRAGLEASDVENPEAGNECCHVAGNVTALETMRERLQVSAPLVAFCESVQEDEEMGAQQGWQAKPTEITTSNKMCTLYVWARALPSSVT